MKEELLKKEADRLDELLRLPDNKRSEAAPEIFNTFATRAARNRGQFPLILAPPGFIGSLALLTGGVVTGALAIPLLPASFALPLCAAVISRRSEWHWIVSRMKEELVEQKERVTSEQKVAEKERAQLDLPGLSHEGEIGKKSSLHVHFRKAPVKGCQGTHGVTPDPTTEYYRESYRVGGHMVEKCYTYHPQDNMLFYKEGLLI